MGLNKKFRLGLLIITTLLCFIPFTYRTSAATIKYSGKSDDLKWSIDSNGVLRITGKGDYDRDWSDTSISPIWCDYNNKITSAVINVTGITSTNSMFEGCSKLKKITFKKFDTSKVTDMSMMFFDCTKLTSIDVSSFDTSNVTKMWAMFGECRSLTTIDVSGFNTRKVKDMDDMFNRCTSLKSLDLRNFDTRNVESLGGMFGCCDNLETLKLGKIDASKACCNNMFYGCSKLTTYLYFTNADPSERYTDVFTDAATAGKAKIWVNCDRSCSNKAMNKIVATKSPNSHIIKCYNVAKPKIKLLKTGIYISWSDSSNGYQIYRKASNESSYKRIKTTTATHYTDTSVVTGKKYTYKIRKYVKTSFGTKYSKFSSAVSKFWIKAPAIKSLSNYASKSMEITWSKTSKAHGYEIIIADNKSFKSAKRDICEPTKRAYSGLTVGKTYYVKVRAYMIDGSKIRYSAFSSAKHVTIRK